MKEFIQRWYHTPLFWEIVVLDFFSKMILYRLVADKFYKLAPFLTIQLHCNYGLSWGVATTHNSLVHLGLSIVIIAVLAGLAVFTTKQEEEGHNVTGLTMMLAGGFGNLIDRLLHGYVLDFIKISYAGYAFPIFNIADIFISVGAAITLYYWLMGDESE